MRSACAHARADGGVVYEGEQMSREQQMMLYDALQRGSVLPEPQNTKSWSSCSPARSCSTGGTTPSTSCSSR